MVLRHARGWSSLGFCIGIGHAVEDKHCVTLMASMLVEMPLSWQHSIMTG